MCSSLALVFMEGRANTIQQVTINGTALFFLEHVMSPRAKFGFIFSLAGELGTV